MDVQVFPRLFSQYENLQLHAPTLDIVNTALFTSSRALNRVSRRILHMNASYGRILQYCEVSPDKTLITVEVLQYGFP